MKGYKHLTEKEKTDILSVYGETKSVVATAQVLGINKARVRYYLKRQGIKLSGYRMTACYRNFDLVVRMAQDGVSYSEIARVVGTNHHRVKEFLERYDIEHPGHVQAGKNNPNWKGGRTIDKDGYVLIRMPNHPNADSHGYVREHRLLMSEALGRPLSDDEVVHHLDDNHQNNSLDNLKLYRTNGEHLAETLKGKVPNWSREGKAKILEGCRRSRDQRQKTNQD